MTPGTLLSLIAFLPSHQPISLSLEHELARRGQRTLPPLCVGQKQHWQSWLRGYRRGDGCGRARGRRSAEFVFQHLQCPPMLMWLAEASGVPRRQLLAARRAVLSAPAVLGTQSAALRTVIPWSHIEPRLAPVSVPALSIRPHMAHAIIHFGKCIENRVWPTRHRGPLIIHAGKHLTAAELAELSDLAQRLRLKHPAAQEIQCGGLVGLVDLTDVVSRHRSPWFNGRGYGWVIERARPLAFVEWTGQQRLFRIEGVPNCLVLN